jgi:UDP-N-acetylmuramate--alanine ligase
MSSLERDTIDLSRLRHVHLVGIGGRHMSAIARILLARGIAVTGSDIAPSAYTQRLEHAGATIYAGHAAENVGRADLVVTTVAARETNPELRAARERGIPVVVRAEMVAALMQGKTAVCVAGTHGKTTTSSLLAFALQLAGRAPAYLLGGDALDLGDNASPGAGSEIVVEADEYAEAFLHYWPDVAVITNVEIDHLDYFKTEQRLLGAFAAFLGRVRPGGTLAVCVDSPALRDLVTDRAVRGTIAAEVQTYALDRSADWTARFDRYTAALQQFTVFHRQRQFDTFTTPLAGRHNVANCLGAIAALHALGVSKPDIVRAIAAFRGARRRFEHVGSRDGVTVFDDYAHHPTEVRATIAAARERFAGKRLVVVFQPHTYSRSEYLLDGFRRCFRAADRLLLLQTFAARETAEAGLDAYQLASHISAPVPSVVDDHAAAVRWLLANARPGDLVLTMGAGNVDGVGREFLAALANNTGASAR